MTKVLALNSIRGKSGKDTLISLLESEGRSVFRVAFADILKKECAGVLAMSPSDAKFLEEHMHKSSKDTPNFSLSLTHMPDSNYKDFLHSNHFGTSELMKPRSLRWHLQQYGTEYIRQHLGKPGHWADKGIELIKEGFESSKDMVVITDLRMSNEYDKLHTHNWDLQTAVIVRDWFIPGVDDQPYHISDIALMAHPFDGLVVNRLGEPWAMLDQLKEQGVID